jgi:protein-arginine kinase activator protein McsA
MKHEECNKCVCGACEMKRDKCDGCAVCYKTPAKTLVQPYEGVISCFSGIWEGKQYHEGKSIERREHDPSIQGRKER